MSIYRTKDGVELYCEYGFETCPDARREAIVNGCGTDGIIGFIVPDSINGVDVSEACNIHDFDYEFGLVIEDKDRADRSFRNNLVRLVTARLPKAIYKPVNPKSFFIYRKLCEFANAARRNEYAHDLKQALNLCQVYYEAVRNFGGGAFWSGKDKSPVAARRVK